MNLITNWDPFKELDMFQDRLANMFGREPAKIEDGPTSQIMSSENWRPLVDIVEDDKEFVITAELPQVAKEDVKVTVENDLLTISGERKTEKKEKTKKYHRVERSYGSFLRSFSIADNVDPKLIKADYKDGLLKIHLPKTATSEKKAIDVKIS